jgi:uncharacterized protein Yka (UPF0111/DUF47 family)
MRADGGPKVILKKEKEVIDLIGNHLDKVEEELKIAKETVETFLRGDMSKAEFLAHRMDEIDTEANYIRYDICDRLYNGAYLPVLRGHKIGGYCRCVLRLLFGTAARNSRGP